MNIERRARLLVSLYPHEWRERFGEEFTQLLVDDAADRPLSPARVADVVAHAVLAWVTAAGLVGHGPSASADVLRGVRALTALTAAFLAVAVGIWSQLDVAATWAAPAGAGTHAAIVVMSTALLGVLGAAAVAVAVVGYAACRAAWRSRAVGLALLLVLACGALLALGSAHLVPQWPGGRHPVWGEHWVVVPLLARGGWAATQWLTAYWLHPDVFARLPGGRLTWAIVSPLLLGAMVIAALRVTREVTLSARASRALAVTGVLATGLAAVFVTAAASWILSAPGGPGQVFRAGSVDDGAIVALTLALIAGGHLTRRVTSAAWDLTRT